MDAETIQNSIIKLGRQDFRGVVGLLLRHVFNLNAISVDGTNDGGTDWRVFKDSGGTSTVAYQDTVQLQSWEEKVVRDARTAVEKSGSTRFFFFTPRSHSALTLRRLENQITSELRIPATCLSAREISQFIVESNLVHEFLDVIGAPLATGVAQRPDHREILLHAYSNLSADKLNHQSEIYDESLLLASHLFGPRTKDELVIEAIKLLNCAETRGPALLKRIDFLLSRRQLRMTAEKNLIIDPRVAGEIEDSERLYLKEFESLQAAQSALLADHFNLTWTPSDAQHASVHLSRIFVKAQLDSVTFAGAVISAPGLTKHLGDPSQDLRDHLKHVGVPNSKIQQVVGELIEQAKELPLIKKLTRAAVFVSLEGSDPISSAKAIGAPRWSDINTILDASVAIPFLCARLYKPNSNSFFNASFQAVSQLTGLGAQMRITWNYINECASHLLRALDYQNLKDFSTELEYSQNAYVANYFRLRNQGTRVPESIGEYLSTFSSAVTRRGMDKDRWVRSVMPDLQRLLGEYGVEFEFVSHIPEAVKKEFEVEYTYQLHAENRHKSLMLIDHDVDTMAHLKRQISERGEHWMLLTWDRAMIAVGKKTGDCGWVVSPEIALDFSQPYRPLSQMDLCAVAHRIARLRERPESLSAAILDRVVAFARDELQDWEFRKKLASFKNDIIARVDFSKPDYSDWVDSETDKFLHSFGVSTSREVEL